MAYSNIQLGRGLTGRKENGGWMEFSTAVYHEEREDEKRGNGLAFGKEWNWGRGEECMVLCIGPSIPSIFKGY